MRGRVGEAGAQHVDLRGGDARHRRPDHAAHLPHELRRGDVGGHEAADLAEDGDVGCRERDLVVARHRVAQRPPERPHRVRVDSRAGRHPGDVVLGDLGDHQALDGEQGQRAVALGDVELVGGAPEVGQELPDRPDRVVAEGGGIEARRVAHAKDPPSGGGDGGSIATATGAGVGPGAPLPAAAAPGGGGGTGPSRASPRRSVVDHEGSRPGATRRTSGIPGCGSTSHSRATRSPCQRTAYEMRPWSVGASWTSHPCPYQAAGTSDDSTRVGVAVAASLGRRQLAHEQVAHERQHRRRRPPVMAVPHAPAADAGVDGLGPRPGRGGGVEHPAEPVDAAVVAAPQLDGGELHREVGPQPGVADALEERVPVDQRALGPQRVERGGDAAVGGREQVEGRAGGERADRAGVDAPPRPRRDRRRAEALGGERERRLDVGPHRRGEPRRVLGGVGLSGGAQQLVGRPQPGDRPEVVPVVLVDRAEVLGRRPGREEPHERPVGGRSAAAARLAARTAPLAVDPVGAAGDRLDDALDERRVAGEPPVAAQRHQRGAVAVPLVVLAEEEPVGPLPPRIRGQHPGDLLVVPVPVECVEQVGGVAEPEAVVGRRPRGDLVAVVEQQQEAPIGRHRLRQPVVGQHESHAPVALRPPPGRHRRRGGSAWGNAGAAISRRWAAAGRRARVPPSSGMAARNVAPWASGYTNAACASPAGSRTGATQRSPAPPPKTVAAESPSWKVEAATAPGRAWEQQGHPPVDRHGRAPEVDALDDGQALGVVGPHGEGERHRDGRRVLDLDDDQLAAALGAAAPHGVHPLDGVARRDAHGGLDHRRGVHQALAHRHLARGHVPAVVGADPPVERPAVVPGGDQPAGVDDRLAPRVEVADGRPVPVGGVDEERQAAPGHERRRSRVVLPFEPRGPHPARAELGGGTRAQRPHQRLRAHRHEVGGHVDVGVLLAEALERRQVSDGVVGDAQAAHRPAQHPAAHRPHSRIPWCSDTLARRRRPR